MPRARGRDRNKDRGRNHDRGHDDPGSFDDLVDDLVDAGSREHYADAALYDYEYRRRRADVNFYRELAKQRLERDRAARGAPVATRLPGVQRHALGKMVGSRIGSRTAARTTDSTSTAPPGLSILDLGAGSGRVTIPLVRDGHRVVALDQSPAMLGKLRERVAALPQAARDRAEVITGDLCTFELGRKFDLVIAAFNVFEHLYTRGEVEACLRRVLAHLSPGGALAFDVQLPDLAWLIRDPTKRWAKTRFKDPSTGRAVFYSTNHDYDPVSQIALIRIYYDPVDGGPGRVVKLSQRKFFPAELEALVAHAGLAVMERYGDFSFGPLDAGSDSQVVVCEAAVPRRRPGG